MTKPKTKCKCNIRGIIELYKIKKGVNYKIDPYDWTRMLKMFKFCPICGKELR